MNLNDVLYVPPMPMVEDIMIKKQPSSPRRYEDLFAGVVGRQLAHGDDRGPVHVGHHARAPHGEHALLSRDLAHRVEDVLVATAYRPVGRK